MPMVTNLRIDAHAWVRALRLEHYRVAQIRDLRVGEQFWVAFFSGPGITPEADGHCEAYIERVRGGYQFNAVWTMKWTGKPARAHIITNGSFNLLPGNIIEFEAAKDVEAERSFRKVCGYAGYISRHAKEYGIEPIYHGAPYHCHALWRGVTVRKNGCTRWGVEGPEPRGLGAIVEVAIALCVEDAIVQRIVVDSESQSEAAAREMARIMSSDSALGGTVVVDAAGQATLTKSS